MKSAQPQSPPQKICIANMWYGANYGGILTALALCRVLEQMGHHTALLPPVLDVDWHADSHFRQFLKNCGLKLLAPAITPDEIAALNAAFDTFIVGSDQVWRYRYTSDLPGYHFFLDFVYPGKRRVAIAASIGTQFCEAPEGWRREAAKYLRAFDAVSLRESECIDSFVSQYGVGAESILDPVFLCSQDTWISFEPAPREVDAPYIFSYILDNNPANDAIVQKIAERENLPVRQIGDGACSPQAKESTVQTWLANIRNCNHLVTDSFHGVCFALIFNKPFTCIANYNRGYVRFSSLLNMVNLTGRIIESGSSVESVDKLLPIDWDYVNSVLAKRRDFSLKWIQEALLKEKSEQQIQYEQLLQLFFLKEYENRKLTTLEKIGDLKNVLCQAVLLQTYAKKYRKFKLKYLFSCGKKRKYYKSQMKQFKGLVRTSTEAQRVIQSYLENM